MFFRTTSESQIVQLLVILKVFFIFPSLFKRFFSSTLKLCGFIDNFEIILDTYKTAYQSQEMMDMWDPFKINNVEIDTGHDDIISIEENITIQVTIENVGSEVANDVIISLSNTNAVKQYDVRQAGF